MSGPDRDKFPAGSGPSDDYVDPFLDADPEARAREERRRAREAKRRERAGRASLGSRVGDVIDGVAEKGRDAIDEARQRATTPPEPPPDAPEPPKMRRPAPAAGNEQDRWTAEELMPRREARRERAAGATDELELPPPPVERREDALGTAEWLATEEGAPPPLPPPRRPRIGSHPTPPSGPRHGMPAWLRWLVALLLIVLIVVAAAIAVPKLVDRISGDDPAPIESKPKQAPTTTLTIPEGYTRKQIAELATDAGLRGNYKKASRHAPKAFHAERRGAASDATLEGFLFPSTYELRRRARVDDLVDQQLTAFNTNIAQVNLKKAKKANLTEYDVVIIASMIEREVMVAEERPVVAAVIYNRLREGIPLGIDATLRYHLDNFDEPLTESELQTDSPFNTRLVQGLPPTPIANPGLASLEAAANPTDDDYLYYVVKPNTCGEHFFTADYDEFLAASEEYNSAREAEGKAPTDC